MNYFQQIRSTIIKIKKEIFMSAMNQHCKGEWFEMVSASLENKNVKFSKIPLPGFPDKQIQINTTGQSGRDTLCEAFIFYEDCLETFKNSSSFEKKDKKLLDFGVGWGRILRFFVKNFYPENLIGVDINEELLNICKSTFKWGTFIKSNPHPPINLPDSSIDFVMAYSVFSHLSEDACLNWIKEFSRIIRPGGIAALTTRGQWFLDYCESLKAKKVEGYSHHLSVLFEDFDDARKRYDQGEFLHSNIEGVSGGGPLNSSFYGETFIPEHYAKVYYAPFFKVLDFVFIPGRSIHPTMFFQKM